MVLVSMTAPLALGQEAGDAPHPAHIHSGTCDNLGDIVAPLSDVTELTAGETFGAASAVLVKESETDLELPLGDILAAPHAINITRVRRRSRTTSPAGTSAAASSTATWSLGCESSMIPDIMGSPCSRVLTPARG
jgi:hypothetical protein